MSIALLSHLYENTAPMAPNNPALAAAMIIPASSTPHITAMILVLKSISSRLAARVPVQAPVPGSGIPTKSNSAIGSPFPAFALSFAPPLCPFSRQKRKNFPIIGLSAPHSRTLRAKRKIIGCFRQVST